MTVYLPEQINLEEVKIDMENHVLQLLDEATAKRLLRIYELFEEGKFVQAYNEMKNQDTVFTSTGDCYHYYSIEFFVNVQIRDLLNRYRHSLNQLILLSSGIKQAATMEMHL